jgi:hypothetical protein
VKDKPAADTVREQGAVLKELAKFSGEIGVQGDGSSAKYVP